MITELARLCRLGRVVSPLSLVLGFVWGVRAFDIDQLSPKKIGQPGCRAK
jgi:hypothetical protein